MNDWVSFDYIENGLRRRNRHSIRNPLHGPKLG
jgi:hypothetical protein